MPSARRFVDRAVPHAGGPAARGDPARCAADARLVSHLAEHNFTGPDYERFENDLASYALSVLHGWLRTGFIFHLAAKAGYVLNPGAADLEDLARDSVARSDIAVATVAVALPRFRRRALIGGDWSSTGGASLATYFLGACLQTFPNELRRWQTERRRWARAESATADAATTALPYEGAIADPVHEVLDKACIHELLLGADPRTRAIIALTADGYNQEEIVEMLGETSVRSVEGVLYRWRQKRRRGQRRGDTTHG
jgi:DNA-directed RNA polymerase specialized sigma24 family protein